MSESMIRHAWGKDACAQTGKRRFRDHREAVEALHYASNARKRAAEAGCDSNRQEKRSYRCKSCHGWHLTSREAWVAAA